MSAPNSALRDALEALASALRQASLRWYVFGAQAAIVYGRPRLTADIDVTVDAGLKGWRGLVASLGQAGLASRSPDLEEFVGRTRVIPLVHEPTGIPVDLVLAGPMGLEQEFLARARMVDLGGARVPVISPEDLVASKILAGRPRDLEDVRGILREMAEHLDLERIRELLLRLEQALDRSDLLPELERLLRTLPPAPP